MKRRPLGVSRLHKPVLFDSVLSHLALKAGQIVLDGTVGSGGHAEAILQAIQPGGILIGLDQDEEALKRTKNRLEQMGGRFILERCNFRKLDQALSRLNFYKVHAVLLDIGVSSEQLESSKRGFSFQLDGPLDMRMDRREDLRADMLIAKASQGELESIFRNFGEERFARRIAQVIVRERQKSPIQTTVELKKIIESSVPARYRFGRIHPATRIFQALRIAVNDELGALEEGLSKAFDVLEQGGRLAVISFHSLEDRIVKRFFIRQKGTGKGIILTKKPICASDEELEMNPRARSAKLRVIERS